MKNTYYGEIVRGNVGPVFKIYNGTFQKLGNFEADAYPIGTRITVTLEEPEPPKERIVLPEGMRWVSHNQVWSLYTPEGAAIAQVKEIDAAGIVWPPFKVGEFAIYHGKTDDEAMKLVENALAEHGYFGVRKVVDNE